MSTPDIFISYARGDADTAKLFAETFRGEGLDVWWDDALQAGEVFDEAIEAALRAAKAVVVLWSPDAVASRWVRAEATLADSNKTLVPAIIRPCSLPIVFALNQTPDLSRWNGDRDDGTWQHFLADVRRLVGAGPAFPARSPIVPARPQPTLDQVSIVVLPFANMSRDEEQEYFADGITEDIITDLSKVSSLGVISRNSAFTYKGKHVDIPDVARLLNVTHVVEGSVRKAGNRVRVTAQLIDGSTNNHVWADRWDRDLDDIFELQDELSTAIVDALKIKLLPQEKKAIEQRGTSNVRAYDLLLQAQASLRTRNAAGIRRGIELVEAAVAEDPGFPEAWNLLGFANIQSTIFSPETREWAFPRSQEAFRKVIEIAPDTEIALASEANSALFRRDWLAVDQCMARGLSPRGEQLPGLAYFLVSVGRLNEALDAYRSMVRTDPLMTVEMAQFALICARLTAEAKAELTRVQKISSDPAVAEFFELTRTMAEEAREAAKDQLRRYLTLRDGYLPVLEEVLRDFDDEEAALARVHKAFDEDYYQDFSHQAGLAYFAAYFGDDDLALACLRRAYVDMRGVTVVIVWHPLFAGLRQTDSFKQLIRDTGHYDYWRESGNWGDFARPVGEDDFEIIA